MARAPTPVMMETSRIMRAFFRGPDGSPLPTIRSGPWLASGRLLHKVAGTPPSTNCIPATPADAFVGGGYRPNAGQDATKPGRSITDNRGAAIVFRLETSALLGARRLAREGNRPDFSSVNLKPMG